MGKFHVKIRTKFGEISVNGDSSEEILDLVKEALNLEKDVDALIPEEKLVSPMPTTPAPPTAAKKELEGIIEVTTDGRPQITVPPERLTGKDVIGLLLFWKYPQGLSTNELKDLASLSWKSVDQGTIAARIADLKGLIIKEGHKGKFVYKLSGTGKSWVERNLLPRLRGEKTKD